MIDWSWDVEIFTSLLTLTALEVVLGIDNLIFLSVASQSLPEQRRATARRLGLIGALGMRVALLIALVWITGLITPMVTIGALALSWRDLILIAGGVFLLYKATAGIHGEVENRSENDAVAAANGMVAAVMQIMVLDLVFSFDSIMTAIAMTRFLPVMLAAIIIAIAIMMLAAKPVGDFIKAHPTTKMLALSFLILVGVALVADGLHFHIPRGYIYFAIVFSFAVEALNLIAGRGREKI